MWVDRMTSHTSFRRDRGETEGKRRILIEFRSKRLDETDQKGGGGRIGPKDSSELLDSMSVVVQSISSAKGIINISY